MTNKLTVQYRKGTLPSRFYYFKNKAGYTCAVDYHSLSVKGCEDVEVLSEVPSFEEYEKLSSKVLQLEKELSDAKEYCDYSITNRKQLTKQINHWMDKCEQLEKRLDIAVKCLKEYASPEQWEDCTDENGVLYFKGLLCNEGHLNAVHALKKIKEVK